MNLSAQDITAEILTLPQQEQLEVIDFIQFLKQKLQRSFTQSFPVSTQQTQPQTEGARVLAILEKAGLLGCMEGAEEDLSENYKQYLWNDK